MLRCSILTIFLASSLLAGAQDRKVVRENSQKTFPKTVAAGNYSGIAHLHDDIYAVVSDKSVRNFFNIGLDDTKSMKHTV